MSKYKATAQEIVECIGGMQNIDSVTNCMTRLRFSLKNDKIVDTKKLESVKGVQGIVNKNGQFQIVIGTDVSNVCDEINKMGKLETDSKMNMSDQSLVNKIIGAITAIFQPIIPGICGAGMIKATLALCIAFGWLDATSQTYIMLTMVADTAFYFLPIFLAFSSAKVFGANPYLATIMGAMLLHPTFNSLVAAGEPIAIFGIPVRLVNYGSGVVSPVLIIFVMAYIEKYTKKIIPSAVSVFMVPLLVFLITAPIAFTIAGPIGSYLGDGLYILFEYLNNTAGWIIPLLMGTFAPLLIMTGMHYSIVPVALAQFTSVGYMTILSPGMLASNIAQATATLYVGLKTKDSKLKQTALSSSLTASFGITEPALYGVILPLKKPLIATMIGGAAAGLWAGLSNMRTFASATAGILALPVYVSDDLSNVRNAVICMIISFVVTLIASFVLGYKDEEKENKDYTEVELNNVKLNKSGIVASPLSGEVVQLSKVNDEVFSKEIMGRGVAIIPKEGVVVAPFSGIVNTIFPTKHAIGITNDDGIEVLIHIGLDTVELDGKYFEKFVESGTHVNQNDILVKFDLDKIKEAGYDIITPVIITNSSDYIDIIETNYNEVKVQDELLKVFI